MTGDIYIFFFLFWKWAHWWRHRHRLDRFRFQNFKSPDWDPLSTYHTSSKICNSPFYYLFMCLKYCCIYCKQCGPWSDAAECGIWPGSTLFAKAYLSQYLGLLRYCWKRCKHNFIHLSAIASFRIYTWCPPGRIPIAQWSAGCDREVIRSPTPTSYKYSWSLPALFHPNISSAKCQALV